MEIPAGRTEAHHDRITSNGTVTARCGLTFTPEPDAFGTRPLTLRPPIDPARCCPAWSRTPHLFTSLTALYAPKPFNSSIRPGDSHGLAFRSAYEVLVSADDSICQRLP